MKYIKNKLDFSVCFKAERNGNEETFSFDCFRTYSDTGNIATTGVTPVTEEDFDFLYKNVKTFKAFVDSGKLVSTSKAEANSVAGKLNDYVKENEALKKELASVKKELGTGESAKIQEKDIEIANLKKELESLKKSKSKSAKEKKADEGTEEANEEANGGF